MENTNNTNETMEMVMETSTGSKKGFMGYVVAGAVAILGGVAAVIVIKRKNKKQNNVETPDTEDQAVEVEVVEVEETEAE